MSDQSSKPDRPLNEISHLFLSSIRDAASNGQPRPQRVPPPGSSPRTNVSMDLTPEEFAQVFGANSATDGAAAVHVEQERIGPVTAVIGAHLSARQFERVKQYARHLAARRKRIGLIEADASEFRLMCFDGTVGAIAGDAGAGESAASESYDPRRMVEAINELNWDVDHWLLFLPNPRVPESRTLLRDVGDWVLLSTCDHDGVVSGYRTLKGLADTRTPADRLVDRPSLSLALFDATDAASAERVFRKLASVCQQFLDWPLAEQVVVREAEAVAENLVVSCRPTRDKAQLGAAPQWDIIGDFLSRAKVSQRSRASVAAEPFRDADQASAEVEPAPSENSHDARTAPAREEAQPMRMTHPSISSAEISKPITSAASSAGGDDVIDLAADEAVLSAILRHRAGEWVECPIVPPMCDKAKLAVARDRRLVLVGEAGNGLTDLRAIGRAYQWLIENSALIALALPQLSIDARQTPHLSLLVDQADASAATLEPMLQSGNVTIQTYRKLKWSGKTGLLLAAA